MHWEVWMRAVWPALVAGRRVLVPASLPHPGSSGFRTPWLAEPAGQAADWVLSLEDGSRLHVHEFANGALVAHRDATDPKRGPIHAALHWTTVCVRASRCGPAPRLRAGSGCGARSEMTSSLFKHCPFDVRDARTSSAPLGHWWPGGTMLAITYPG